MVCIGQHAVYTPIETGDAAALRDALNGFEKLRGIHQEPQHSKTPRAVRQQLTANRAMTMRHPRPTLEAFIDDSHQLGMQQSRQANSLLLRELLGHATY